MPSYKSYVGSRYLTAGELGNKPVRGIVQEIAPEKITNQEGTTRSKLVVTVEGLDKPVVLNVTNCERLAGAFGEDYSAWVGQTVEVRHGYTKFGGRPVGCVEVHPVVD